MLIRAGTLEAMLIDVVMVWLTGEVLRFVWMMVRLSLVFLRVVELWVFMSVDLVMILVV